MPAAAYDERTIRDAVAAWERQQLALCPRCGEPDGQHHYLTCMGWGPAREVREA